jgi:hypothetical protein
LIRDFPLQLECVSYPGRPLKAFLGSLATSLFSLTLPKTRLGIDPDAPPIELTPQGSYRLTPLDSFVWTWLAAIRLQRPDGGALLLLSTPLSRQDGAFRRWILSLPRTQHCAEKSGTSP